VAGSWITPGLGLVIPVLSKATGAKKPESRAVHPCGRHDASAAARASEERE